VKAELEMLKTIVTTFSIFSITIANVPLLIYGFTNNNVKNNNHQLRPFLKRGQYLPISQSRSWSVAGRPFSSSIFLKDKLNPEEQGRLKIYDTRRKAIRSTLKNAEALRNYRIANNLVPEIDEETGKPINSDTKGAVIFTSVIVALGALTLRIGGRAALISAVGLDFANENPELRDNLDKFLAYADTVPPELKGLLFFAGWTFVKVFCFDFGGIILALGAGVIFGGVFKGALLSATAATFGSSVAFFLAKVDTPLRKKALELVEDNPSLRGMERVVAEDGLRAVLTLRLAPILPIPIGMYNYVYGVTNVPYLDFAGGVFLGSIKPYLLDSYLGCFMKTFVEGTLGEPGGMQDIILLVALGVSVLIGVFASQLAGETWDNVREEVEAEQKIQTEDDNGENQKNDGITRSFMGLTMPQWLISGQTTIKDSWVRMEEMTKVEYEAKVWNCTDQNPPLPHQDPARFPDSPEISFSGSSVNLFEVLCDGFVLSPCMIQAFFKYADPLYDISSTIKELPTPALVDIESSSQNEIMVDAVETQSPAEKNTDELLEEVQAQIDSLLANVENDAKKSSIESTPPIPSSSTNNESIVTSDLMPNQRKEESQAKPNREAIPIEIVSVEIDEKEVVDDVVKEEKSKEPDNFSVEQLSKLESVTSPIPEDIPAETLTPEDKYLAEVSNSLSEEIMDNIAPEDKYLEQLLSQIKSKTQKKLDTVNVELQKEP